MTLLRAWLSRGGKPADLIEIASRPTRVKTLPNRPRRLTAQTHLERDRESRFGMHSL